MNSSNITIYSVYKDAGFTWTMASFALALNFVSITGMFMNFAVIFVTYRTKSLHGTANYLLALCSFFEFFHQHIHLLFLYITLSGKNFLPYGMSVRICSIGIFFLGGVAPSIFFTGLDRLLCVLMPSFPKIVNHKLYLAIITGICLICCGLNLIIFLTNDVNPNLMITGFLGEIVLQGFGGQIYGNFTFILYNFTVIIYLIVWLAIRYRNADEQKQRRLFRALCIIIGGNIGGYYLMRIITLFILPLFNSNLTNWFIKQSLGIILNISAASNAPILYFNSVDYRRAFNSEFLKICKLFGIKMNNIKPNSTITVAHMNYRTKEIKLTTTIMVTSQIHKRY